MKSSITLFNFISKLIQVMRDNGRMRTAETYKSALNSYKRFSGGKDISLNRLTRRDIEAYSAWLTSRGLVPNTVSFYNRILRAVYNRAVDCGYADRYGLFKGVYTGVEKTTKRALPLDIIKRIKTVDLHNQPNIRYARDMFMRSFYLRGMSFIDMAYLKKNDLHNGYIIYRRRKTGKRMVVKWTPEMSSILSGYKQSRTQYLLPIINMPGQSELYLYRKKSYNINRQLKRLGENLGLANPLTMYVARHSWASGAHNQGIPINVISESMGHDSESTTRIYLDSLDTSALDRANDIVIRAIH